MIAMLVSQDGDQIVIVSFVSSFNTFACNTAFVSASCWKDIKEGIRIKLEFSILST